MAFGPSLNACPLVSQASWATQPAQTARSLLHELRATPTNPIRRIEQGRANLARPTGSKCSPTTCGPSALVLLTRSTNFIIPNSIIVIIIARRKSARIKASPQTDTGVLIYRLLKMQLACSSGRCRRSQPGALNSSPARSSGERENVQTGAPAVGSSLVCKQASTKLFLVGPS